jgi:type VII secretion ATPase EccA
LNKQIGLVEVKRQIKKLRGEVKVNAARVERGLSPVMRSHHLVFSGPPGTGKTTIARVVGNIYCGLGVLKTPTVLETKRFDFVGEHLGSTAIRTNQLIDRALDGVLFIDEAYTLIQSGLAGGDAFGREAVDTLLARMENDRDQLMVIIAGYDDEIDRFLSSNEGLASRFPRRVRFPSYSPAELAAIASAMAADKDSTIASDAITVLERVCADLAQREVLVDENGKMHKLSDERRAPGATPPGKRRRVLDVAGNGRFIRNVVEDAFGEQMYRISDLMDTEEIDDETLTTITAEDLSTALTTVLASVAPEVLEPATVVRTNQ